MRKVLLGNLFLNPFTQGWACNFVPRGTPHGGMLHTKGDNGKKWGKCIGTTIISQEVYMRNSSLD